MAAVAQLLSLIVGVVAVPMATILLIVADTWEGRGCAVAVLSAAAAILLVSFGRSPTRRRRVRSAAGLGILSVVFVGVIAWRAPPGVAPPSASVSHLWPEGERHHRLSPTNLVPEVDQLMLGFSLMPLIDPLLTLREAGQLKASTRQIYRELEAAVDFRSVGSAMGLTYADLLGGETPQHAYVYVPRGLDRSKPAPVMLFFHGSGGNWKAYIWLFSRIADRLQMIVIAPTGGVGRWTIGETAARVPAALAAAQRIVPIDPMQVHAIGLSNGGRAVSQLLSTAQREYRSFIFLSPVFRDENVRVLSGTTVSRKPGVLIITGALDRRVPLSYVENNARDIRTAGADVTLETIEDADHFLVFTHRDQFSATLERWLTAQR